MRIEKILNTSGRGLWTNVAKEVRVIGLSLGYVSDEGDFGELRVRFDKRQWNVEKLGLIYTDPMFERELKTLLKDLGFRANSVTYSEQGMQGNDYVSCDVGKQFINSFKRITGE